MNLVTVTVFGNLNDDLCAEHKKTDSWFGYGPNCAGPPGSCYAKKKVFHLLSTCFHIFTLSCIFVL